MGILLKVTLAAFMTVLALSGAPHALIARATQTALAGPQAAAVERPWADAFQTLADLQSGADLLLTADRFGVTVKRAALPASIYGRYDSATRTVLVSEALDGASVRERAAVLAHELQHAADHASGLFSPTTVLDGATCLDVEAPAYARMGRVWQESWGGAPPPGASTLTSALNTLGRWAEHGDAEVRRQLKALGANACGGH